MLEWLWYVAFGFNIGSALAWWMAIHHYARRDRERWEIWRQREEAQIARWAHLERCPTCSAWLNDYNARLAARPWHDDA